MNSSASGAIEILSDKRKSGPLLIACILFIVLGIWFVLLPPHVHGGSEMRTFIRIVGVFCILFFGLGASFFYKK